MVAKSRSALTLAAVLLEDAHMRESTEVAVSLRASRTWQIRRNLQSAGRSSRDAPHTERGPNKPGYKTTREATRPAMQSNAVASANENETDARAERPGR